jgi:hypothetical protein
MWPDHDDHGRINSDGIETETQIPLSINQEEREPPTESKPRKLMIVSRAEKLYRVVGAMK